MHYSMACVARFDDLLWNPSCLRGQGGVANRQAERFDEFLWNPSCPLPLLARTNRRSAEMAHGDASTNPIPQHAARDSGEPFALFWLSKPNRSAPTWGNGDCFEPFSLFLLGEPDGPWPARRVRDGFEPFLLLLLSESDRSWPR